MQMQKFALPFATCEENYNTVVAVDSGHNTSKTADSKFVTLLRLDQFCHAKFYDGTNNNTQHFDLSI